MGTKCFYKLKHAFFHTNSVSLVFNAQSLQKTTFSSNTVEMLYGATLIARVK